MGWLPDEDIIISHLDTILAIMKPEPESAIEFSSINRDLEFIRIGRIQENIHISTIIQKLVINPRKSINQIALLSHILWPLRLILQ